MPRARDAVKQLVVRAGAGQVRPSNWNVTDHERYMSSLRRNQSVTSVLLKGRANGAPTRIGRARRCSANRAHDEPLMAPSLGDALIAVSHTRPSSARVSSPVHTRPPQLTPTGVTPPHVAVLRCRVTARPQRRLQRAPRLPQPRDAVRISHYALCNSVCASRESAKPPAIRTR